MRQPKRSDDKYWTGTRIFHEEQFISDLQDHIDLLNERIEALSIANVSNRYSIEDIEKCVEHWGLCKVEKEYIERFLNGC